MRPVLQVWRELPRGSSGADRLGGRAPRGRRRVLVRREQLEGVVDVVAHSQLVEEEVSVEGPAQSLLDVQEVQVEAV